MMNQILTEEDEITLENDVGKKRRSLQCFGLTGDIEINITGKKL